MGAPQHAARACACAAEKTNYSLAPAVALKMLPSFRQAVPATQKQEPRDVPHLAAARAAKGQAYAEATPARDPVFYERAWAHQASTIDPGPPNAPLRFSYEQLCLNRLGPMAFVPDAALTVPEFQSNLLRGYMEYQVQHQGVEMPPSKVNYANIAAPLPYLDVFENSEETKDELRSAIDSNKTITRALFKEALKMKDAMSHYDMAPEGRRGERRRLVSEGGEELPETEEPAQFHKVSLKVTVARATELPETDFLYSCDPYVIVTVVDGDPLSPEAACGNDAAAAAEWYSKHLQFEMRTETVCDDRNPRWSALLQGEVYRREHSFVHFRVMDSTYITQRDKGLGQAVVPMADVLRNAWAAPRSIALIPMDRKSQTRWAELTHTRLVVSISWEGIISQVESQTRFESSAGGYAANTAKRFETRREKSNDRRERW